MRELKKKNSKLPKVGQRSIKTAIATTLCAIVYVLIDRNATFACIGAVFGIEGENELTPWKTGGNRLIGTVLGGFLGMGLFFIKQQFNNKFFEILILTIGIILLIYISQLFGCPGAIQGGAVVFYIVMLNTPTDQYITYALNRMLDTAIGVFVAVLVNTTLSRARMEKWFKLKN